MKLKSKRFVSQSDGESLLQSGDSGLELEDADAEFSVMDEKQGSSEHPSSVEDKVLLETEIKEVRGYKKSKTKQWLVYRLLCVLTLGIWYVACRLSPRLRVFSTCSKCPLETASVLLVQDLTGNYDAVKVKTLRIRTDFSGDVSAGKSVTDEEEFRIFEFQQLRFVYDKKVQQFRVQHLNPYSLLLSESTQQFSGLNSTIHRQRLLAFGSNEISIKPQKKYKRIIKTILEPIHVLMFIVVMLFCAKAITGQRESVFYGILVFFTNIFSIYLQLSQKSLSLRILKDLVATYGREMRVIRDNECFISGSASLVPGDLVEINGRVTLPCDMILIRGEVEVEESMITGDTVPAQKVSYELLSTTTQPLAPQSGGGMAFQMPYIQQENTLIGGTKILRASNKRTGGPVDELCPSADADAAIALVIRTGYSSTKGKIIRQVLQTQRSHRVHSYIRDSRVYTVIAFAFGLIWIGLSLFFYCAWPQLSGDVSFSLLNILDGILTLLPPVLPILVSWPVFIAQRRLKKKNIKATNLQSFLQFGSVDCVCYDKTGVLTEDTLAFYGVLQPDPQSYGAARNGRPVPPLFEDRIRRDVDSDISPDIISAMACCHNLSLINNDQITGDKLEITLFDTTEYEFQRAASNARKGAGSTRFVVQPPSKFNERGAIQVVSAFPFSTELRRMSVLIRLPRRCVFSKGSPKSIRAVCRPETVPSNLDNMVRKYGLMGMRVIAVAKREVPDELLRQGFDALSRQDLEKDMTFMGIILLKNKLHRETIDEIRRIKGEKSRVFGSSFFKKILAKVGPKKSNHTGNDDGGNSEADEAWQAQYYLASDVTSPQALNIRKDSESEEEKGLRIRSIVVTGDTAYTAVAVAKECGIIEPRRRILLADVEDMQEGETAPRVVWNEISPALDGDQGDPNTELVVSGRAFELLRNHRERDDSEKSKEQLLMYSRIIVRTNIFAEMLPIQKAELVSDLKSLDYTVAMCGDGSNDSLALTAADVSLSLSEAETSYAAQFTNNQSKLSVSFMIADSRALLDKILHNFKFLLIFIVIQFCQASHSNGLRHVNQFVALVWSNYVIALLLVVVSALSKPVERLRARRPPSGLVRLPFLLSVLLQIALQIGLFALVLIVFNRQPWVMEYSYTSPDPKLVPNIESTVIFIFANFQHLATAASVLCYNYKFTRPWSSNGLLIVLLALILGGNLLILWPLPPSFFGKRLRFRENSVLKIDLAVHLPNAFWVPLGLAREPVDMQFAHEFWVFRTFVLLPIALANIVVSFFAEVLVASVVQIYKQYISSSSRSRHYYKTLMLK